MLLGGTERVVATLSKAWVERGFQVTIMPTFSGGGKCFYDLDERVRIIYLASLIKDTASVKKIKRFIALRRFIKIQAPDVIISFLPNVNVAAILTTAFLNIPLVICERSNPFIRKSSFVWKLACAFTYPFASTLMVQTQEVAKNYKNKRNLINELFVIANPLPNEFLATQLTEKKTDRGKIILAVGRYAPEKQFDRLLKAIAHLNHEHADWILRIVGEGPERSHLEELISQLGLQNRVELPGVSKNVLLEMQKADIFCLTSKYEGFPNSLLEAMAVGLPCISFDCPSGPKEMTDHGKAALLIEPDNFEALVSNLDRLLKDKEERKKYAALAYDFSHKNYSLNTILTQWDNLFAKLGILK